MNASISIVNYFLHKSGAAIVPVSNSVIEKILLTLSGGVSAPIKAHA